MLPVSYVVADKRQELADTWTLELEPAGGDGVGEFRPGQFSMLYAFGAGEVPISVSGGGGGRRSRRSHDARGRRRDQRALRVSSPAPRSASAGPFGNSWPLEEAEGGDVVVVAGGIGLAPLRLAIKHLIANRDAYRAVVAALRRPLARRDALLRASSQRWREAGIDVEYTVDSAPSGWDGPRRAGHHADPERGLRGRADHRDGLRPRGDDALRLHGAAGPRRPGWTASTSRSSGT